MIRLQQCVIDANATLGNSLLLTDIVPAFRWVDGKPTKDVDGYKYIVCSEALGLEKIAVKVEGKRRFDLPKTFEKVKFDGLEMTVYFREGSPQLAAKATNIALSLKPEIPKA